MYSNKQTMTSTASFSDKLAQLKEQLNAADAVVIGAGAGMSAAAGFSYSGERFMKHFADFHEKYGINDMYSGGFYPYNTQEEYWAWWSRAILVNRYDVPAGKPYCDLLKAISGKDYFVLTTNVDHQFHKAGFDKQRLFYTQGDYGLWQCTDGCKNETFDNEAQVREMAAKQQDMKIPAELIPRCPHCGKPLTMNLRCDDNFVQDAGWYAARSRYERFLNRCQDARVLFLELGVGMNTPVIIKYPFWQMTANNRNAFYACLNMGEAYAPPELRQQSLCIDADIASVLGNLTV